MFLHRLILNPLNTQARRDLASRYELHRTLVAALAPDADVPPTQRYLWRLEMAVDGVPQLLVQTPEPADWSRLERIHRGYCKDVAANKPVPLNAIESGRRFSFRLHASPSRVREGRRVNLVTEGDQLAWLDRVSRENGFTVLKCTRGRDYTESSRKSDGNVLALAVAEFDGVLEVDDAEKVRSALGAGLGRGKAFGLGLLSLGRL